MPTTYDPNSSSEQAVPLPNAPIRRVNDILSVQPPLSRRGHGPGLLLLLSDDYLVSASNRPLDPEPVQKWAEEGFAVAFAVTHTSLDIQQLLADAATALMSLAETLDVHDKFGVVVYDERVLQGALAAVADDERYMCSVGYSSQVQDAYPQKPLLLHTLHQEHSDHDLRENLEVHTYATSSPHFVLPNANSYDPGSAALAHTRSLVFLREHIGGPHFDREAIWDEHTRFEFEVRSVAKTMGTMVAEPYVNHIPTMTGGVGRENLTRFYRDHFIFSNPVDARLQVVSRTVGPDRIVDEFVYHITHDRQVDWLLPGVPATHKKLSVPMLAVVNIRGDRLYNEHIWWDQATALKQAGLLQEYVSFPTPEGNEKVLRLPVAGVECAEMLLDESKGRSNEMLSETWRLVRNAD